MMELTPIISSNLKALGHDEEKNELHVEFKGGAVYAYDGVSKELFDKIMSAESKGSAFDKEIKKAGFTFRKIK